MIRRTLWAAAICGCFASLANAQAFPSRPMTFVVGYPAGGAVDGLGRALAKRMSEKLGQPIVVDNKPGASETLAAHQVAKAKPDGYTILVSTEAPITQNQYLYKSLTYNPDTELLPVSIVVKVPVALAVSPEFPADSFAAFLQNAKSRKPGDEVKFGSAGIGGVTHLPAAMLATKAPFGWVHVPYKGSGPSITDLIGGQVQYTFDTPPAVLEHVRAGKLRALAVATRQRLASAPQVPTFAEAGLPGFSGGTWFGLFAPAKTPRAVVDRINTETVSLLNSPELSKAFADRGIVASPQTPEEFGRFVQSEVNKWKDLAGKVGIVAE